METSRKSLRFFYTLFLILVVHCVKPSNQQAQAPKKIQDKAIAEYKIADQSFQQSHMAQAMAQFQNIVKLYSNTTSADNAMLRIAQIYKREKNLDLAQSTLKKMLASYPDSDVRYQAFRELTAISIQNGKFEDALTYMVDIDLKKLSPKEASSINAAAQMCIQRVKRDDLTLLWAINYTDVNTSPEIQGKILDQVNNITDKTLLERIITKRKTAFPALEASMQRYKLAKQSSESDSKKWALYIVEYFPTSSQAQELRADINEPIPFKVVNGQFNIGVILPLTGDQQAYGTQVLNGIKTAVEVVKQSAPSMNINLIIQDIGQGGDDVAKQTLQKMLTENQIIAAIGPLSAKDTANIADLAQTNNLPVISLSPAENVTGYGSTIFRNSITKNEQATAIAQFLVKTMGIHRSAILYPNNTYGKEFMELFWHEFEKQGGEIRGAQEYDRDSSDYEAPIKKLVGLWHKELRKSEICSKSQTDEWNQMKKAGGTLPKCFPIEELPPITDFEAVFVPDSYDKARQILPTLLYYDVRGVQIVGTNLWNSPELLSGSIGNEMEGSIFLDGFLKSSTNPQVTAFMQKFYALYNAEPGILEGQGYDSAMAIFHAIARKGPSSREAMTKQLYKLSDFKGVTGLVQFNDHRDAVRNLATLTVNQNKIVEIH